MKIIVILLSISLFGCHCTKNSKHNKATEITTMATPSPRVLVYKTKADYINCVPIFLSEDKTTIVSYPHPSDLKVENKFLKPIILNHQYILDNKGIGPNIAFLKTSYEEYSKYTEAPSIQELEKLIIDRDPLTEMWDCGYLSSFKDLTSELNSVIDKKEMKKKWKKIK